MVATAFSSIIGSVNPLTRKHMSEELDQETEPINAVEEPIQETEIEIQAEPDAEALKAELERVKAEKDLQHKRATKAEAELKKLKPLTTNQSSSDSDARFERLELKTEGYKSEEVDFLMQNGGRKALENPIVMAGIEAMRKKQKSQDATPSGTAKSAVYQKYTEQDLRKMPAAELEKIIPQ